MLNKNTLGVKKARGQSEATCKQAGATKSPEAKKLITTSKTLLTPLITYSYNSNIVYSIFFTIGFVT